jgi:hypothetical protein
MSITRIFIFTLLILSGVVAFMLFDLESNSPDTGNMDTSSEPQNPAQAPVASGAPSAPLIAQSQFDTNEIPDEEMSEDEAQNEMEQIAAAMTLLESNMDEERLEGVEQLAAYPNLESEMMLCQLLMTDVNDEVRNAAAQGLEAIDSPSDSTIADLLNALEDEAEDVRLSALSTLEGYMLRLEENSANYKKIQSGLIAKATNPSVPKDTRDNINEFLKDQ